jgi:RNA polymerase sigma-70 factor (ECF subfamily)
MTLSTVCAKVKAEDGYHGKLMNQQQLYSLLRRIQQGDEEALLELHAQYANLVYSIAYRVLLDSQSAEELTQDLFMRLWHKAELFDPERGQFVSWLATMTRRLAIDRLRQQKRNLSAEHSVSMDAQPYLWETELVYEDLSDLQRTLLSTLDQLSKEQQQAIKLAYFNGMTHVEIAAYLGKPLGTIKSHIRQGMELLRQLWLADSSIRSE